MYKKIILFLSVAVVALLFSPNDGFAQSDSIESESILVAQLVAQNEPVMSLVIRERPRSLREASANITDFLDLVLGITFGLLFLFFLYNVGIFVLRGSVGTSSTPEIAKDRLIWATIGMFVAFSLWGIIGLIERFFGFSDKLTLFDWLKFIFNN